VRRERRAVTGLATQTDVDGLVNLYLQYFDQSEAADEPIIHNQQSNIPLSLEDEDLGMEGISNHDSKTLCTLLDFVDGRPITFNTHRHKAGITPWDREDVAVKLTDHPEDNPELEPLRLRWHQLAGVMAMVSQNFYANPQPADEQSTGTLVADQVGLGKTFQAAGVIAFLSQVYHRQKAG